MCESSLIYDLSTHQKQRKPEVLHILGKFGYEREEENNDDMEIMIVASKKESKNRLYIPNQALRKRLEFSKLARENNYEFVDSLDGEIILDKVYFGEEYRLTNRTQCLKKQLELKKSFTHF